MKVRYDLKNKRGSYGVKKSRRGSMKMSEFRWMMGGRKVKSRFA